MFSRSLIALFAVALLGAGPFDVSSALHWRMIGPFRGGRTVAIDGVHRAGSDLLYIGVNNGGVWRSDDVGRTWKSLFDAQPTQSIGALAVAPSDPNVIYAGSGEALQRPDLSVGDGIYRSDDAGATWQHLGLRDAQQIGALAVDPRDPKRLFAAALGHPYGANNERGVYRSTDSGVTWQRVLFKDENTGAVAVTLDPTNPDIVYASLWAARSPAWNLAGSTEIPGSGLFRSTDGGTTWTELSDGLPADRGRIGIAIARSNSARIYAWVDSAKASGIYRSEDAGAHWQRVNGEERVSGRGQDFSGLAVDPTDPDTLYVANTSTYRSTDGGATYTAIKGAPGGDDYHTIWIDPQNRDMVALASDQGATVSPNRGATWSSWYNQPTAQFYHVSADNRFPYRVFGGQQESGSIGTLSRGDNGAITFRDWVTVGAFEYDYVEPDPLHPWLIYGSSPNVYDERTKQSHDIAPEPVRLGAHRYVRTKPLAFSPVDPHRLYLGLNNVLETRDGGTHWRDISPDLGRKNPGYPPSFGPFAGHEPEAKPHLGVVYALAPSHQHADVLWAGTNDGNVQRTSDDGRHWRNITPPGVAAWSSIAQIDAGRFDDNTAYVAVNRLKVDDLQPYVYRTHDGGTTWTQIGRGIPTNEPVNAVREDPVRRGLLYAATERGVYASFDDGAHWSSVRANLPASSIRDIIVHGDDLVVATHGRSFWILDDITPLRAIAAASARAQLAVLPPQTAVRVRANINTDTPLPPEEPAGENPPDGALLTYVLPADMHAVAIEIRTPSGALVRRYASDDPIPNDAALDKPTYWFRPPARPSASAGIHRFVWDLHDTPPRVENHDYPIAAIIHDTPREPRGAASLPGRYTVRLIADGQTVRTQLVVRMDPRVPVTATALRLQHTLAVRTVAALNRASAKHNRRLVAQFSGLLAAIESSDGAPTPASQVTYATLMRMLDGNISTVDEHTGSVGEP